MCHTTPPISPCLDFKPDGVQRGLVGNIIARFESRGFKLIALKLVHATTEHLEKRQHSHFRAIMFR